MICFHAQAAGFSSQKILNLPQIYRQKLKKIKILCVKNVVPSWVPVTNNPSSSSCILWLKGLKTSRAAAYWTKVQ